MLSLLNKARGTIMCETAEKQHSQAALDFLQKLTMERQILTQGTAN